MRTIELVKKDWSQEFNQEAKLLKETLGDIIINIHHIGSTAIPGIYAKPIIDMILEVADINKLDRFNKKFEALGYVPKGEYGIAGRRYFQKGGDLRTHHIHAFAIGNEEIARHVRFRYYLRANKAKANEYESLKLSLAKKFKHDPEKYWLGKNDLIKQLDIEALTSDTKS
ncbi:MAG: GrpB family protein [Bacteroidetes bacterium]|nr:GrpB family protein [Bacteroidota bacterium]